MNPTSFSFWAHVIFSALGAAVLYHQWGRSQLRAYALTELFETMEFQEERNRKLAEMITFIIVGTMIAIGVGQPHTVPQAFAAGAGFTGLAARPTSASNKQHSTSKRKRTPRRKASDES